VKKNNSLRYQYKTYANGSVGFMRDGDFVELGLEDPRVPSELRAAIESSARALKRSAAIVPPQSDKKHNSNPAKMRSALACAIRAVHE
jgi:hypothetical protein